VSERWTKQLVIIADVCAYLDKTQTLS
jgi:hypothetical protein